MIKLSVIIPCYNVEEYLPKCIDSVLNNKLEDIEIILVNDGSKDNTLDVINSYKEKYDDVIKVIDQKNQGLSGARNTGIQVAKGEYITFLDSDDYVDEVMYKEMLDKAYQGNYDMVTCGVKMVYSDHDLDVNLGYNEDLDSKEMIKKQMYNFYPAACNKIYKKSVIGDLRFKVGVVYEDVEFMYRLLPNLNNIGYVSGNYYYYIQREGSITYTFNKKLYNLVDNFDSIFKYYKDNKIFKNYKDELEYTFVRYSFATFVKRLAKCKDKNEYNKGVDYAISKVKSLFPDYKKNKYLIGKKGLYLKHFNKLIAKGIYLVEKNKMN